MGRILTNPDQVKVGQGESRSVKAGQGETELKSEVQGPRSKSRMGLIGLMGRLQKTE